MPPSVAGGATTLSDLLAEPALRLACLVDAGRLSTPVRWAHPTELSDPSPYLSGGELVCTVGTSLGTDDVVRRFVAAVADVGGAGICFGVGDVVDEVPAQLVSECEARELPLLVAPHGVPFMAISELLVARRAEAEAKARERSDELVGELLLGLRAHVPIEVLLELAGTRTGGELRIVTGDTGLTGAAPDTAVVDVDGVALRWTGPSPGPDRSFLETVARLVAVARHERDVEDELRRERVGELISLVAQRLAAPAALEAALLVSGMPRERLVFSHWPPGASRLLAATLADQPHVLGETPTMTVVVTAGPDWPRAAADRLALVCGYSRTVGLADSTRALGEARAAYDLAVRRGTRVGPEGLTTLEGLLAQQPPERLAPFVHLVLDPLVEADRRRRTSLLGTLRAFLASSGSLVDTARAEFLHVNTVRHRLERIRDITGRDPLDPVDRVDLMIALWAHEHRDL